MLFASFFVKRCIFILNVYVNVLNVVGLKHHFCGSRLRGKRSSSSFGVDSKATFSLGFSYSS